MDRQAEVIGQLELFRDTDGSVVKVGIRNGVYQVSLARGRCSCGSPLCEHLALARDLVENGGKRYLGWVKSAMHKEIRTGDFEAACRWAVLWEMCKPGAVRRYVRKIWAEESRNVEGLERAFKERGWRTPLYTLCRSPKDWTLSWDIGWASPGAMRAWARADSVDFDVSAFEGEDIEAALVMFWKAGGPSGSGAEWQRIVSVLRERVVDVYPGLEKMAFYNDELSLLIEVVFGVWRPEQANFFETPPAPRERENEGGVFIPCFPDYAFDSHTWLGRKWLSEAELDWQKPMQGRLDLRWSGDWAGTLWRYLAFREHGTVDIAWQNVAVPDDIREFFHARLGRVGAEKS